jgi:hypothetical protein
LRQVMGCKIKRFLYVCMMMNIVVKINEKRGEGGKGDKDFMVMFFYCINLFLLQTTGKKTTDIVEISLQDNGNSKKMEISLLLLCTFLSSSGCFHGQKGGELPIPVKCAQRVVVPQRT